MSEKTSIKLTRRETILGAIGAVGTVIAASITVNDKLEQNRIDEAVASRINTFRADALEEKRITQQSVKKTEEPAHAPIHIPALPVAEVKSVEQVEKPEKPFTRIGYFRDGFNDNDFAQFCSMVKTQEDVLDIPGKVNNVGISTERIKIYFERFGLMVDKILPLAHRAADLGIYHKPDPEFKDLFNCLVLTESIGESDAVSEAGAIGLTQVMPIGAMDAVLIVGRKWQKEPEIYGPLWDLVKRSNPITAKIVNPRDFDPAKIKVTDFKKENLTDPAVNIALGAVEFSAAIDRFDGNIGMALSSYNAGPGKYRSAVNKYWELEGNPSVMPTNRPNFIEVFKKRKELGLEDENNENWVYLPRILAIYRKIHGPQVFPLTA